MPYATLGVPNQHLRVTAMVRSHAVTQGPPLFLPNRWQACAWFSVKSERYRYKIERAHSLVARRLPRHITLVKPAGRPPGTPPQTPVMKTTKAGHLILVTSNRKEARHGWTYNGDRTGHARCVLRAQTVPTGLSPLRRHRLIILLLRVWLGRLLCPAPCFVLFLACGPSHPLGIAVQWERHPQPRLKTWRSLLRTPSPMQWHR